eukprot:scaffold16967_cov18-Tisochrysis_lutea.AAC.1
MLTRCTHRCHPLASGVWGCRTPNKRRLQLKSTPSDSNLGELSRFLGSESGASQQQQTLEDVEARFRQLSLHIKERNKRGGLHGCACVHGQPG